MLVIVTGLGNVAVSTEPIKLKFATMGLGTSPYVYAVTISRIAEKYLPAEYKIDIETTGGGISGPLLISAKKADIATSNSVSAKWVTEGIVLGRPKAEGIRAIAGGLDCPYVVIIFTENFMKKTGISTLEEIASKKYPVRVAVKTKGGLGEAAAEQVLELANASYENIKSWGGSIIHANSSEIVDMLRDNRADITIDHIPAGQAAISELTMTTDIRFVPISAGIRDELAKLGWEKVIMPKDTWKQQDADIPTVSSPQVIIVREDLADDVVYALTKAICENKSALVAAHASLEVFDPKVAWKIEKTGVLLHSAAEKYYRDKGYMK